MLTSSEPKHPTSATIEQELQQTVAKVMQQAVDHHKSGEIQAAEELYRGVIEVQPNHPDANHNLGVLVVQHKQPQAGLPFLQTALEAQPENEQYWISYIEALIQDKQFTVAAETLFLGRKHGLQGDKVDQLAARLQTDHQQLPEHPEENHLPGPSRQDIKKLNSLQRRGRLSAIEAFARDLTVRFPEHSLGWKVLGMVLIQQDAGDEAFQALHQASTLLPEDPEVLNSYAELLRTRGRLAEAEENFKKSLKLAPELCITLNNYGNLLRQQGRYVEAEEYFRKALQQKEDAAIHNNMGTALLDDGRIVESEACFRRALKISPGYATACLNLGVSLRKQGRLVEAVKHQRRAVKLEPQNTEHFSNLLFTLNYSSNSADYFLEEARQFGQVVAKKVKEPFSSWQCDAQAERLRVGFVSGDLYNHPVGFFLESLLGYFDSTRIELIAYPTNPKEDDLTSRIKPLFFAWRPLFGLSDEAAAKKIRDEGVHVLFDLAGHTSHNRLAMMVWKPAPIQASWLGYFATTGVEAIDYFLADEVGVPAVHQKNFSETIWYLPETRLCFSSPHQKVSVSPLPALKNGYVTFGCFQQYTKVGDDVLTLWSAILAELPASRLRWQCKQLGDPQVVEQLHARLKKLGINPSQVETVGQMSREGYFVAHGEVDLLLDSFPYPGGTTTCEALWMGVPTVTLAGESLLSRQGASLLTAAGLPDWITASAEEYVAKAVAMASNLESLAELRARLRKQILASPLFDAERFARNFEDAIRGMWEQKRPREACLVKPGVNEENASAAKDDKPIMNFFNPVHWGTKDPALFNDLMRKASEQTTAFHYGDNMFVFQRNNSMLNDQSFMQSWKENAITPPDQTIIWRRYILAMAAFHCQYLEGDFVECGAYQGVGAKTVIDYLGGSSFPKTFWLYDVFEHNEKMVNHSMQAHGPQLYQQVVKRFKDYPNVKILKGFLPDILAEGSPEKIAYLHLDLNQAPAEIATLDALFDRVVPGGMIILDDYEMVFYRAQKLAEDEWFGKRGYKVFPLPTSQGFVIKR